MLNTIQNSGKSGIKWTELFSRFTHLTENELLSQLAGLIDFGQAHERSGVIYPGPAPKRRGRPKVHNSDASRVSAYRQRKRVEGRRLEIYLPDRASWRLSALADAWGCRRSKAVERLLMEADERYRAELFPTKDSIGA